MITQEENSFLTRIGPATPAGQLLRRYWHPIAAAVELTEEKPKKRVRVLGEDLLLYRNQNGGYGLVRETQKLETPRASSRSSAAIPPCTCPGGP